MSGILEVEFLVPLIEDRGDLAVALSAVCDLGDISSESFEDKGSTHNLGPKMEEQTVADRSS